MAAAGHVFHNAKDIVECWIEKYAELSTNYCIEEISEEELQLGRKEALSLDLCFEVQLSCVFVRNVRMIMDHVIFSMIIL